ncbi:hypothetical protein Gasu2_16840 [Galdieria sulphuraria]|nr:hypothetical protein Gasu2_16840 [Galdieria sulphuraria]
MKVRLFWGNNSFLVVFLFFGFLYFSWAEDDPETLQLREQSLLQQLKDVDREAIEYRREIQLLKEEEKRMEAEYKKLKQARDWELKKMQEKEKQVEQLQQSTNQKQQVVDTLVERIEENKKEIEKLEKQLQELTDDKEYLEHRYYSPSLSEVLDELSTKWDPLSRNIAKLYRQKWSRELTETYRWAPLLSSCFIYGCVTIIILLLILIIRRVGKRLSVSKLLFLSDVTFTVFWLIILFASTIFWTDGFQALAENNEVLFLLLQLSLFTFYSGIIALRVFLFAMSLSWQILLELLILLILCQHYYIHLWQPSMTDSPFTATWKSYLFYYLTFQLLMWYKAAKFGLVPSLSTLRIRGLAFVWRRGKNRLFMEPDLTKQPFTVKYA